MTEKQSRSGRVLAPRRAAALGIIAGAGLSAFKLAAGVFGQSFALVADALESLLDVVASAIVWGGLRWSAREPDEQHPYGHGRAESLAALAVAGFVLVAGIGIGVQAVREILSPQTSPKAWTLAVLVVVVVVKEVLYRVVRRSAQESGSSAVHADAWHHRSDAMTSLAAAIGISISVFGGPGYEAAEDWAALVASAVIIVNAALLGIGPMNELMDRQDPATIARARAAAETVAGVRRVQKVFTRKLGTGYWVDMHVWVDPTMNVRDAHRVAHAVKDAVRLHERRVIDVLVHVEPDAGA